MGKKQAGFWLPAIFFAVAAENPGNSSNSADNTQRASSSGSYGVWGLPGLLGLFGLGRRRAVRSDIDTRRDLEPRDRDTRRVA